MNPSQCVDDVRLIHAVQSKELLFNKGHHFYKNVMQKELAWRAIAEECQDSVDTVKKRWKILRDRFVRELRNYGKIKDDSSMVWERFEQLIFLRHHVNHKNIDLPLENIKSDEIEKILPVQLQHICAQVCSNGACPSVISQIPASQNTANIHSDTTENSGTPCGVYGNVENAIETYDNTIKYMFSEDDGINSSILEGDELLNEFLIRKKRDTSTSPTQSNGGSANLCGGGSSSSGHKFISDTQLITAIRSRKCLYEKGNANYKNIAEKEKMWKQVAEDCGAESVRAVRSRWKQLRDRFGRELKSAQLCKSGWKLFEDMLFIKDYVNVRTSISNNNDVDKSCAIIEDEHIDVKEINIAHLISLVKQNSVIYDKSHRHHSNDARKQQAWESIANEMQISENTIKTQWHAILEKLQRERKNLKMNNSSSTWPFYNHLNFIKNSFKCSINELIDDKISSPHEIKLITTDSTSNNHQHHAVVIVSAPSNNQHPVVTTYSTNVSEEPLNAKSELLSPTRKRRNDSCTGSHINDIIHVSGNEIDVHVDSLEKQIENIVKRIVSRDGDVKTIGGCIPVTYEEEFFSRYICEKLKSFPKKLRSDAKSHIFQYLHELDNTLK